MIVAHFGAVEIIGHIEIEVAGELKDKFGEDVEAGLVEISKTDVYSWQINNDRQRLVSLVEEAVNSIQRKVEVH